jgi:amino acid transporter
MMYAFARDGGIPGHRFFQKVDPKTKSPIRTVWLACTLSFILGLPSLGSSVAFSAATRCETSPRRPFSVYSRLPWLRSIATIGLYISYGIPIALRLWNRKNFVRGPFHLGKFSYPVAIVAVLWICLISIVFVLPQSNPRQCADIQLRYRRCGYSCVILGHTFWLVSARKWFKGPIKQIEGEVELQSGGGSLIPSCS